MVVIYVLALCHAVVYWGLLKIHSVECRKPLRILHWGALYKTLFKWPIVSILRLELDTHVLVGKTLKQLTKLLDRLKGIWYGYDEGMESRTIIELANGKRHKFWGELKNAGPLLYRILLFFHIVIGGGQIFLVFPFICFPSLVFMCVVCRFSCCWLFV